MRAGGRGASGARAGRRLLGLLLLGALLLGGLVLGAGRPARAQALDVLDLYHELQVAQPNGFPAYEIAARDGGLITSGPSLFERDGRVSARMDPARLYLRIDDGTASGAGFVTEIAVWLDPEGAPLLGLSERAQAAGRPTGGRVRFYSRASGRWNLVTDEVLPSPAARVCAVPAAPVDESTAGFADLGPAIVLLPATGTDVTVWCLPPSPAAGTGRMMAWARETGRFEAGPALSGPPPWTDTPAPR